MNESKHCSPHISGICKVSEPRAQGDLDEAPLVTDKYLFLCILNSDYDHNNFEDEEEGRLHKGVDKS